MSAPQLQTEEVDAALVVARGYGWVQLLPVEQGSDNRWYGHISSMQMYKVLQVAFGAESTRLNRELREETQHLKQLAQDRRDELRRIQIQRNELRREIGQIRQVSQLVESTRRFIQLASDTPAVQMARAFQDMEALLTTLEKYGEE